MDDSRWFASNRYCALFVLGLRERGLEIALDGDRPAQLAIAMDAQFAAEAGRYAARHRCPLIHYVWDLPPWWLGPGRHDSVWLVAGPFGSLPPPGPPYAARRGVFSRPPLLPGPSPAPSGPSPGAAAGAGGKGRGGNPPGP